MPLSFIELCLINNNSNGDGKDDTDNIIKNMNLHSTYVLLATAQNIIQQALDKCLLNECIYNLLCKTRLLYCVLNVSFQIENVNSLSLPESTFTPAPPFMFDTLRNIHFCLYEFIIQGPHLLCLSFVKGFELKCQAGNINVRSSQA